MKPDLDPVPESINGYPVVAHRPATPSRDEVCEVVLCRVVSKPDEYVTWTWNRQAGGASHGKYAQALDAAVTDFFARHTPVNKYTRADVRVTDHVHTAEFCEIDWHIRDLGLRRITCSCGADVVCSGFTATCRHCGADYNSAGQRLAPREVWGEETGEQASDVLVSDEALVRSLDEG